MEAITAETVWAVVGGILAAIVLIGNAAERVAKALRALKAPNAAQDESIAELQRQQRETDAYLRQEMQWRVSTDKSNAVTQRALLALLGHGLHGNNIDQMQASEIELQNHLINR